MIIIVIIVMMVAIIMVTMIISEIFVSELLCYVSFYKRLLNNKGYISNFSFHTFSCYTLF